MNSSRARFRLILIFRDSLRNEDSITSDDTALTLRNKEQGELLRKDKVLNNKKAPLANSVHGCTGCSDITDTWRKCCMHGFISSKFTVSNGVRQGEILSPFLFNVYMDDLSVNLKKCPTGCIAGGTVVNHLVYADDILYY